MLTNQFGEDIEKGINWGSKTMLILLMALLVIIIVPLLVSILFEQGLIPNDGLTMIFYVILVPVMAIAAVTYVIWKKM